MKNVIYINCKTCSYGFLSIFLLTKSKHLSQILLRLLKKFRGSKYTLVGDKLAWYLVVSKCDLGD